MTKAEIRDMANSQIICEIVKISMHAEYKGGFTKKAMHQIEALCNELSDRGIVYDDFFEEDFIKAVAI